MRYYRKTFIGAMVVGWFAAILGTADGGLLTAGGAEEAAPVSPASGTGTPLLSVDETARETDALFEALWRSRDVIPADPATDTEYLRRLYLDLAGRIPAVSEVREFLANPDSSRRDAVVEQLLDGPAFVRNFTTVWRNALIPQAASQPQYRALVPGFEAWLWTQIASDTPYDRIVHQIITLPVNASNGTPSVLNSASSPEAFFISRDLQPENVATGTSRAFLGVRLDCAQCHNHPFDHWKQQQFWQLAAFYADLPGANDDSLALPTGGEGSASRRSIRIPSTGETVPAVFLTGETPAWTDTTSPREVLADWITDGRNPWFARMAVNRMWAQFFGRGLVNPVDDFSEQNPPAHPAVLDLLATQFVAHDYDLKFLIRSITRTRVYRTGSRQTHASQADGTVFARAALRGMTAEQFFDSLAEAVGYYQPYLADNPFRTDDDSPRGRFLELFRDDAESPLQRQTTILQALAMMNGEFIDQATSLEDSQTLRAVADFPLMSDGERLETLFLATVSRPPTTRELSTFLPFLEANAHAVDGSPATGSPATGSAATGFAATGFAATGSGDALGDVFWVLLNSSEFLLNH